VAALPGSSAGRARDGGRRNVKFASTGQALTSGHRCSARIPAARTATAPSRPV